MASTRPIIDTAGNHGQSPDSTHFRLMILSMFAEVMEIADGFWYNVEYETSWKSAAVGSKTSPCCRIA